MAERHERFCGLAFLVLLIRQYGYNATHILLDAVWRITYYQTPACPTLTARPDRSATGAKLAAVLLDQRGVATFLANLAGHRLDSGSPALRFRTFQHTHLLHRILARAPTARATASALPPSSHIAKKLG